jgi:hypothetical protein
MSKDQPFLYYGGRFVENVLVAPEEFTVRPDERITINFEREGNLAMSFADAEALVIKMIERLYDKNALSMEAAERLTFLGNSVLADKQATQTCAVCGQAIPNDVDCCPDLGCGEHPYAEWPCPTCDFCDKSECSTPEMVWDGDTGCHVTCQQAAGEAATRFADGIHTDPTGFPFPKAGE